MTMSTNVKVVIGLGVATALVVGAVVASRETDPMAPGPAYPPSSLRTYPQNPATPPPLTPSPDPVAGSCQDEDKFTRELTMYFSSGTINTDLVMCTDASQTGTLLKNTSSTVYYVAQGYDGPYWNEETDSSREADVRMFRAAVREVFSESGRRPALTIEPGENVQFIETPGTLRFGINRQQQAAWRTAVLQGIVYDKAKEQATDQIEDYFQKRTPTGFAAVTCTVNAYQVGKTIGGTVDDPSSLLFENVYESGEGAVECVTALAAAEKASQEEGRVPVLSKQSLLQVSRQPAWKQPTNSGFQKVFKFGTEVLKARY